MDFQTLFNNFLKLRALMSLFGFIDRLSGKDNFDMSSMLAGLLTGGVIGYAAATLFAPQSGKETRAYLSDKSQELTNKVKGTMEDTMDKANQLISKGEDKTREKEGQAKEQFEAGKQEAKDYTNQAREHASDTLNRAADKIQP